VSISLNTPDLRSVHRINRGQCSGFDNNRNRNCHRYGVASRPALGTLRRRLLRRTGNVGDDCCSSPSGDGRCPLDKAAIRAGSVVVGEGDPVAFGTPGGWETGAQETGLIELPASDSGRSIVGRDGASGSSMSRRGDS
jgi:hypothetical protein